MKEVNEEVVVNEDNNDIEAQAEEILKNHPGPIELNNITGIGQTLIGIRESYPEYVNEMMTLGLEWSSILSTIGGNKKHKCGESVFPGTDTDSVMISNAEDKKSIAVLYVKTKKFVDKIKAKYPDANSPYRKMIDIYGEGLDLLMSKDYQTIMEMDTMLMPGIKSTFLTFPNDMFFTGEVDEKGNKKYSSNPERFGALLNKYPFIEQISHRINFVNKVYLPYVKKKERGEVTEKEAEEFRVQYLDFINKQKEYFETIKTANKNDKDFIDNRTVDKTGANQFIANWGSRFGNKTIQVTEDNTQILNRGWLPEDISLFDQLKLMKKKLESNSKPNVKNISKEQIAEAKKILDDMNEAYTRLTTREVVSAEERKELLDKITPFVERFNSWYKKIKVVPEHRTLEDHPIKGLLDRAKKRKVLQSEIKSVVSDERILENNNEIFRKDRIIYGYMNAATIEDKINYIVDLHSYLRIYKEKKPPVLFAEEHTAYDAIETDFLNKYVTNGSQKTRQLVFKLLGQINTANSIEMKNEIDRIYKEKPELKEEGEIGFKKALYLTKMSTKAGIRYDGLNNLMGIASNATTDGRAEREINRIVRITPETTMEELARMQGYSTDEEINKFLNEHKDKPARTKNVLERYKGLFDDPEDVPDDDTCIENITNGVLRGRKNKLLVEGGEKEKAKHNLTLEDNKLVDTISLQKKLETNYDNFKDWVDTEGKNYIDSHNSAVEREFTSNFYKNHLNQYERYILRSEGAKKRKAKSVEKAHPEFFRRDEDGNFAKAAVSDEERQNIISDFELRETKLLEKQSLKYRKMLRVDEFKNIYSRVFNPPRESSISSIYVIWAMGKHPEIDLNEIVQIEEYSDIVEEFVKFCEDNPVWKMDKADDFKNNIQNWATALKNGTDRIKELKMPDINYTDKDELDGNTRMLLFKLRSLSIDFSQEKDKIFTFGAGLEGKSIAEDFLGTKDYRDMLEFWNGIQNISIPYEYGFINSEQYESENSTEQLAKEMFFTAVSRAFMKIAFKEAPGRTLNNMLKFAGGEKYYLMQIIKDLPNMAPNGVLDEKFAKLVPISLKEVLNYLEDKDVEKFENKVKKLFDKLRPQYEIEGMNDMWMTDMSAFASGISFGSARDILINNIEDAESVKNFLKSKERITGIRKREDGIEPVAWVDLTMRGLFTENYVQAMNSAGVKRSETLLINGKTPLELWGNKYADLDEATRERCLEVETLRAIAMGKSEIKIKTFAIKNGHYELDGKAITCFIPAEKLQDIKVNYEVYKKGAEKIKNELISIQNTLLAGHFEKDPEKAKAEIGTVGSDLFQNMENTLKEAIRILGDKNASFDMIEEKLQLFQKAAATYYKERKSIFDKRTPEAKTRLDVSALSKERIPDIIATYQELTRGIKSDLIISNEHTFKDAKIFHYNMALSDKKFEAGELQKIYQTDKITVNDNLSKHILEDTEAIAREKRMFTEILKKGVKDLGYDYSKMLKLEDSKSPTINEWAMSYVVKSTLEKMHNDGTSTMSLMNMQQKLKQKIDNGSFAKQVERLSKNSVFKATLKIYSKKEKYEKWKEIEAKSESIIKENKQKLDETTVNGEKFTNYIFNGDVNADIPRIEDAMETRYDRLGEIVSAQLINNPAYRSVVNAIASGRMTLHDVQSSVTESLKNKRVIDKWVERDVSFNDMLKKFNDKECEKIAISGIINTVNNNAETFVPEEKKMKATQDIEGPKISAPQAPHA